MADNTPKTSRRQKGGGGVHDTHASVVLTNNVRARHAPLCLSSGILSQKLVQSLRLVREKVTYNVASNNASPIKTNRNDGQDKHALHD